jgi:nicotinate (nicotinamide) nucleotide adenylyltransferase/non-canonical purine NTP pyrophosphatase (RdgB/HAM1 family)
MGGLTGRRAGVFGGTFDPIHLGHLIGAQEAHAVLGLEQVLFVPAHLPPHKLGEPITADADRLAMLALAIADDPRFAISRIDLDRAGASFTVDMLTLLQRELGPEVALHFILGTDSLLELPSWHRPGDIIRLARLAVLNRPGPAPDWAWLEAQVPGLGPAVDWVPIPDIGISATDIRHRVAAGRPIRYQVPAAVEDYIRAHGLYGSEREDEPRAAAGRPRLLVATTNPGKLAELQALLAELPLAAVSPAELSLQLDVPETGASYEANAVLKARAFAQAGGLPTLADDSGLEVEALGGFPGVRSARWVTGPDEARVAALLARLSGVPPSGRAACFQSVAALAWPDGRVVVGRGRVQGRIAAAPRGDGGFGYDPIFLVEDAGYHGALTLAELPAAEKQRLSHRARAVRALWPALRALAELT